MIPFGNSTVAIEALIKKGLKRKYIRVNSHRDIKNGPPSLTEAVWEDLNLAHREVPHPAVLAEVSQRLWGVRLTGVENSEVARESQCDLQCAAGVCFLPIDQ